jgi:hypothetical protein
MTLSLKVLESVAIEKDILEWVTLRWGLKKARPSTPEMLTPILHPKHILGQLL